MATVNAAFFNPSARRSVTITFRTWARFQQAARLYVFVNTFHIDGAQKALINQIKSGGRTSSSGSTRPAMSTKRV